MKELADVIMSLATLVFFYFGALFVPIGYLLLTRFQGSARRMMLLGIGLQLFWSGAVWVFVYFSWRAGYADAWMGWGYLLPVNAVGFIYFVAVLAGHGIKSREPR